MSSPHSEWDATGTWRSVGIGNPAHFWVSAKGEREQPLLHKGLLLREACLPCANSRTPFKFLPVEGETAGQTQLPDSGEGHQSSWLTSAVQGAAAKWRLDSGRWLLHLALHNELIALHETLADELLKHLLGRHLHTFFVPSE